MQIGERGGIGATRIDDDNFQIGAFLFCRFDAAKQNRVGIGGVGTGDEDQVGEIDIFVTRRRRIGAERELVASDGRGHAQARIGIDVVRADQTLGEFVEDIIVLGEQLPGNVKAYRIRAVLFDAIGKSLREKRRVASQDSRWRGAVRDRRTSGNSARPSGFALKCNVEPLLHKRPKFAG